MEHLKIGFEPDFAPLTFQSAIGADGLVVDIVSAAARIAEISFEFISVDLPDQDAAVRRGDVDALAFKAIIADRAGRFDFSTPILNSGAAWFALADTAFAGSGNPAPGVRVSTPVLGPLSAQLKRDFSDITVIDVDTYAGALDAVLAGRADIAALNFHVGCFLAQRDHRDRFLIPRKPYQQLPLGLAVAAGTYGREVSVIDRSLARLDREGKIGEIERRWLVGS